MHGHYLTEDALPFEMAICIDTSLSKVYVKPEYVSPGVPGE